MLKNILVIEDDEICEFYLSEMITMFDPSVIIHRSESAEDGFNAIEFAKSKGRSFDLIISDIFLSGKATGVDILNSCREFFPEIPVLVTSAMTVERFLETIGKDVVPPNFLPKPFSSRESLPIIESMMAYS